MTGHRIGKGKLYIERAHGLGTPRLCAKRERSWQAIQQFNSRPLKKAVRQGHRFDGARSVREVREHDGGPKNAAGGILQRSARRG